VHKPYGARAAEFVLPKQIDLAVVVEFSGTGDLPFFRDGGQS
jgi:hypothetical protein